MRITALAASLCVVVAVAVLLLLIALPGPGVDRGAVDRRTGTVLSATETIVANAVATGDARICLELLTEATANAALDAGTLELVRQLRAELLPPEPLARADTLVPVERIFAAAAAPGSSAGAIGIDARAADLAGRWCTKRDRVQPIELLAMARTLHGHGRPRARDRWLARAISAAPTDVAAPVFAAEAWIAEGRLDEAAALLATVTPGAADSTAYWTLRRDLARWLGDYATESAALQAVLPSSTDARLPARLVEVELARGDRIAAAHAAVALAERTLLPEHYRQAARMLFAAGRLGDGMQLLAQRIAASDDPLPELRLQAQVLLQDLRLDEARRVAEAIVAHGNEAADIEVLENIYRRLDCRGPLIALLRKNPERDSETPFELLHLLAAEDRADEALALLAELLTTVTDPVLFYRLLPLFADAGLADLGDVAAGFAARLEPEQLQLAVDAMGAPGFDPRPSLKVLAARFPEDARIWRLRVDVVWALAERTPHAALVAARELASERTTDRAATSAWVALSVRLADLREELAAREQLAAIAIDDCENTRLLAEIYVRQNRETEAIALLQRAFATGDRSVRGTLLHVLLRAGRTDEVDRLLAACADDGPAALVATADVLFDDGAHTTALRLYQRALELDPENAHAQLRAGILLGWTNRPGEALPLLEKAMRDPLVDRFAAAFALAEVQWALGMQDDARENYELAAAHFADQPATPYTGTMLAKCLHRTGRRREALTIYLGLRNDHDVPIETLLELAELHRELGDEAAFDSTLAMVQRRDPWNRRLLRLRAGQQLAAGDAAGARATLLRIGERHELDAGELADLGRIDEWGGEWGSALSTYRRWAALQDDRDGRGAEQRMHDRLAVHVGLQGTLRSIGDDRTIEAALFGAATIDERTRVQGRIGHGEYRGRSQAVGAGLDDVVTRTPLLDLGLAHRYGDHQDQFGGGIRLHPDSPGDTGVGFWLEQHWISELPSWSLSLRLGLDELWTDPAAAPGLGGRQDTAVLQGYRALSDSSWVNGELGWRGLDAAAPGQSRLHDGDLVGNVQLGHRWTDGDVAVADRFRAHRVPAGPESPYVGHGPRVRGDLHCSTWLGFTADHLLDNAALTTILPLAERLHFLYLGARFDRRLTDCLGASIDGLVGREFELDTTSWEVAAALTWRPNLVFELDGRVGIGDAFGRPGFASDVLFLHLEGVLRW